MSEIIASFELSAGLSVSISPALILSLYLGISSTFTTAEKSPLTARYKNPQLFLDFILPEPPTVIIPFSSIDAPADSLYHLVPKTSYLNSSGTTPAGFTQTIAVAEFADSFLPLYARQV